MNIGLEGDSAPVSEVLQTLSDGMTQECQAGSIPLERGVGDVDSILTLSDLLKLHELRCMYELMSSPSSFYSGVTLSVYILQLRCAENLSLWSPL